MIRFTVPGEPVAWQRVTRGKIHGKPVLPAESRAWQNTIRDYAGLELRRIGQALSYPCGGYFWLGAQFFLGTYKVKTALHCFDPDLDNLLKNVKDALQGIIFNNDKQVRGYLPGTVKFLGQPKPRVEIAVIHENFMDFGEIKTYSELPK